MECAYKQVREQARSTFAVLEDRLESLSPGLQPLANAVLVEGPRRWPGL